MKAASFFGFTAVILGALGAHALRDILEPQQLESFKTGVSYQMYHALLLAFIYLLMEKNRNNKILLWARNTSIIGIILFSASIYLLSLQGVLGLSLKFLGPITPIGGLFLISSWGLLAVFAFTKERSF